MFLFKSIGTYEAQSVQDGYLNEDGSISTSTRRGITDFIDVSNLSAIRLLSGFASIAYAKFTYAVLYDASKNIISAIKYSTALDDLQADIFIPDGVKYIRLTISSKDISAQYSKLNLTSMSEELNKKFLLRKFKMFLTDYRIKEKNFHCHQYRMDSLIKTVQFYQIHLIIEGLQITLMFQRVLQL